MFWSPEYIFCNEMCLTACYSFILIGINHIFKVWLSEETLLIHLISKSRDYLYISWGIGKASVLLGAHYCTQRISSGAEKFQRESMISVSDTLVNANLSLFSSWSLWSGSPRKKICNRKSVYDLLSSFTHNWPTSVW